MQPVREDNASVVPGTEPIRPQTLAQCHEVIGALMALVAQMRQQLAEQQQQLAEQHGQIAWLQERVKLDSKTSSKPPSSDGPGSGSRAQRRASGRKRGAQKGHPGNYRALLDEAQVDEIIACAPPVVCECGGAVRVDADEPVRHQVFDAPVVRARVSEYRLQAGCCTACGRPQRARLPAGVPSGQIGPRALALVGVLGTRYHLTQMKIRDLLAQLLGVDFSVGAISQAHGKVAAALKAPVGQAAQSVAAAPVVHLDETRYPREGAGNWVWTAVQPQLAVFSVMPSRARYVVHSLLGEQPQAIVVSDRYAAYAHVPAGQRQLCWAHLLRDFARISERQGLPGRIGAKLLGAGFLLFRWRDAGKPAEAFEPLQRRIRRALEQGCAQTACRRTAATCGQLLKAWASLWTFLRCKDVAPTNNDAERALRPIVLKRKISGPTRSRRGDDFIARGYSVVETCRRQGRDALDFMVQAVTTWLHGTPAPSLVPQGTPSG